MSRGTAIATTWILVCTLVYSWFNGMQSRLFAAPAPTLPQATTEPQMLLFGIVPAWILVTGWHLTHTPHDQLLLRHGSRGTLIAPVALTKTVLGVLFALSASIGATIGLLMTVGITPFNLGDQLYVLLSSALSFVTLAIFMTSITLAFRARRRVEVWFAVGLWLITCVMLLQVPGGFAVSPLGATLPRVTPSPDICALVIAVVAFIVITIALVTFDRMERSRCH